MRPGHISWPDGKTFAFTVFDDTDCATLENVPSVYAFLADLGFRITKSIWPLQGEHTDLLMGSTCEDPEYLRWLIQLQESGFEIGFHNATWHSSPRKDTLRALEEFVRLFGDNPRTFATHANCREGMYWGSARLTSFHRVIYNLLALYRHAGTFEGHVEGSRYFWGDLCRERIYHVRNFVFHEINTLKACPFMPYHDPDRPYVRYWFASSDGACLQSYVDRVSEHNQDRLEEEGGACIMYTHFAKGFFGDGKLDARFRLLMGRLSRKNGWFVPVSALLDYLSRVQGHHIITPRERRALERRWLLDKILHGPS